MNTLFFLTNFLNTFRGPGHPDKIPGHPKFLPLKPKEDKLSRDGMNFSTPTWKTPTPPGGLRTQEVNLCALFSLPKP